MHGHHSRNPAKSPLPFLRAQLRVLYDVPSTVPAGGDYWRAGSEPPMVIGQLPSKRSCLSLLWAALDRASRGWRGIEMTSSFVRQLQQLRHELLDPRAKRVERRWSTRLSQLPLSIIPAPSSAAFTPDFGRHLMDIHRLLVGGPPYRGGETLFQSSSSPRPLIPRPTVRPKAGPSPRATQGPRPCIPRMAVAMWIICKPRSESPTAIPLEMTDPSRPRRNKRVTAIPEAMVPTITAHISQPQGLFWTRTYLRVLAEQRYTGYVGGHRPSAPIHQVSSLCVQGFGKPAGGPEQPSVPSVCKRYLVLPATQAAGRSHQWL